MPCASKIVVFDLDETLGYYTELGMFWDTLKEYLTSIKSDKILNQSDFNKILDLYPEFNRPNIINILNYLKQKKKANHCHKLMIYTNNQGPLEWAKMLIQYFEDKIKYKLFDQIIAAFKVQGKQVEIYRTSHSKTHKDLLKCSKIPEDTQICFLDDVYYPGMSHDNVYYINLKPYEYNLKFDVMIQRFIDSAIIADLPTSCSKYLLDNMNQFAYTYVGKTTQDNAVDKIVSKKVLQHLHTFFNKHTPDMTRRKKNNKNKIKNKTVKNKTVKNN
jgi:hypothetical protein